MTGHYEMLYIIPVKFAGDELEKIQGKVKTLIKKNGGEIDYEEDLGKKRLAYPIKHIHQGFYLLIEFDIDAEKIQTLNEKLKLTSEVLRHLIVAKEKITDEERKAIKEKQKKKEEEKPKMADQFNIEKQLETKKDNKKEIEKEVKKEAKKEESKEETKEAIEEKEDKKDEETKTDDKEKETKKKAETEETKDEDKKSKDKKDKLKLDDLDKKLDEIIDNNLI